MKRIILLLFTCMLLLFNVQAQGAKGQLDIHLNKLILQPGDSLHVTVNYKGDINGIEAQSLATLELIIENEQRMRTHLRWPLINGKASGALYLPDSLPRGKYTLMAGLQQRFFEVIGKIQEPSKNNNSIKAMLLTKDGSWDEQEVQVAPNGTFAIRNWLFEDNGLIAFSGTNNDKQPLNIRISTQLDSSYAPLAVAGRSFYIGNPPAAVRNILNQPVKVSETLFTSGGSILPAVMVRNTVKSPAQQFSDEYSTGLFRSGDERIFSIMDDPTAFGNMDILSYLQGRVPGLQVAAVGFNGGVARWRGAPIVFFMDEMRASPQQVATIPITDIAIVKVFSPPFFGAPSGGGALAIYTRRGGEAAYLPAGRTVFKVRGYSPSTTTLNMNKLNI